MVAKRWWLGLAFVLPLAGCGDDPNKAGPSDAETVEAAATRGVYHDWEAVQLTNGLATVAVVPKLGGRILGFEFEGRPLIYVNPKQFGQTPGEDGTNRQPWSPGTTGRDFAAPEVTATGDAADASAPPADRGPAMPEPAADIVEVPGGGVEGAEPEAAAQAPAPSMPSAQPGTMDDAEEVGEPVDTATLAAEEPLRYVESPQSRQYVNYGGALALPEPRSRWPRSWPPPVAVDLGEYQAEVPAADGDLVAVELTGPADDELHLELSRRVVLLRSSTVVRVEHRLKNTGDETRPWSLADCSQHPGALAGGETFTKDVQVFLPLAPTSRHNLRFASLLGPQVSEQFQPADDLMRIEYLGEESMIGSESRLGWVAYADRRHELVLVKIANLEPDAVYPDQGLTTTVYCAPAASESYVELGLRSPLRELRAGDLLSFSVEYGAARCPAPIVGASRAGCVNTPLVAERLGDAGNTVNLQGVFGVFYAGQAQVAFYDAAGEMLARTTPVTVSPRQVFRLETTAPLPETAVRAALIIVNSARVDVGELDDCGITTAPAREPETLAAPPLPGTEIVPPVVPDVDLEPAEPRPGAAEPALPDAPEMPAADQPTAPE